MQINKLSWMTDDDFNDFVITRKQFDVLDLNFANQPMMKNFSQDKAISLVFNSNKLGNTLPVGAKHSSTYKIMEAITKFIPTAITRWKSDGNSKLNPCQFIQHLKAYYYIMFIKKPLSVDNLLKTHEILMQGSTSDDGKFILCGKLRTFGVNNGVENYMSYKIIKKKT